MKVLFDHQVFSYQAQGGVSRYFAELILGLEARGEAPVRGWRWSPNRYLPGPDLLGAMKFKGKAALRAAWNQSVSRRALKGPFDVFHPTYFDPYFLPLLRARPFVLTLHDMTHELYPEGLKDAAVVPERKRRLALEASRIIAVSENTKLDAVRLWGLDPDRIQVVPHGNALRPSRIEAQEPAVTKPYWLYVGTRSAYKDFAVLVQALAQRGLAERDESLVMVGGGPLTAAERRVLEPLGSGRWSQTDCTEAELAGLYSCALALVYPSRYEGFGLPILEAMAWGCPVIAADASSLPEVGGDAALYFAPGDVTHLGALLETVILPDERSRLSQAGRARESKYSWETAVQKTISAYESACGGH